MDDRLLYSSPLFDYWGKTSRSQDGDLCNFHLLVCHCLDVVAVADAWWDSDPVLRRLFRQLTGQSEDITKAWVLFFTALHDLGKFDVRFQSKATDVAKQLRPDFIPRDSKEYYHGEYAFYWMVADTGTRRLSDAWRLWLRAVAGHHGAIPETNAGFTKPRARPAETDRDLKARGAFLAGCEEAFLKPVGLRANDKPTFLEDTDWKKSLLRVLAGFCSVCDWLGSMEHDSAGAPAFSFVQCWNPAHSFTDYLEERRPVAEKVVAQSGLYRPALARGGMAQLFADKLPRQVQTLVDDIPLGQGLTLIEAATGSGKTEAALAYASQLLAAGKAESIIFALPTQATANAMLERLESVAPKLYPNSGDAANLVLAHGKSRFNPRFADLKKVAERRTHQSQGQELDSAIACARWLAQSRKRVFLGQIGVCTVDQVMISVLPLLHNFVRSFGLAKSVLIIDEVHAYDAYMYGILEEVIRLQRFMGGSIVLLSATLPLSQRQALVNAWTGTPDDTCPVPLERDVAYPLVTHVSSDASGTFLVLDEAEHQKAERQAAKPVVLEIRRSGDMRPDAALLDEIAESAKAGALVAVICNLVDDAQQVAGELRERFEAVDLFHSRFRFTDRQKKEAQILAAYGKQNKTRARGRVLVATQVVEQSLDLDFDWMVTQLCPIDSLFQRLGRLHRHDRKETRPPAFEKPRCTVLAPIRADPDQPDYGLHQKIYGVGDVDNRRVLWRTETVLGRSDVLDFPHCYRPLVEEVYDPRDWRGEPDSVRMAGGTFQLIARQSRKCAQDLTREAISTFRDTDVHAATLTRDGEMSLNVVPIVRRDGGDYLLDGRPETPVDRLPDHEHDELINLHTVPVPAGWRGYLEQFGEQRDCAWYIPFTADHGHWTCSGDAMRLTYSVEDGLRRST